MTSMHDTQSASFPVSGKSAMVFPDAYLVGKEAALLLAAKVKEFSNAVIILPTGVTPLPLYEAFISLFTEDKDIDLSSTTFFNLDEYVGLSKDHPLSYNFYMRTVLYDKLQKIDRARAPKDKNIFIPYVAPDSNPIKAAIAYENLINKAIAATGRGGADLAFLGIGGVSPSLNPKTGLVEHKGAHIGFNEPGTPVQYGTHLVRLTEKTRKDTQFRFVNLNKRGDKIYSEYVPEFALTLGIKNIMECLNIVIMATGESKALVIREVFNAYENHDLTASLLFAHKKVKWLLDADASFLLPKDVKITEKGFNHTDFALKWHNLLETVLENFTEANADTVLEETAKDLNLDVAAINEQKSYFADKVADIDMSKDTLMPKNSNVLIFSPHPDDDVISMGATIEALSRRNNKIKIAYMVTGENSVREIDYVPAEKIEKKHKEFMHANGRCPEYKEVRAMAKEAKIETRKEEAKDALVSLGLSSENIVFLESEYYYLRGFVDIDPVCDKDKNKIRELFEDFKPDSIFYSAEHDPNGAHGIGAKLIQTVAASMPDFWDVSFYGYCGAYKEWNLAYTESFVVLPFPEKVWDMKEKAIKYHKSQLKPEFPGGDERPFYARVNSRNLRTGRILRSLGFSKEYGRGEVFKIFSCEEFLKQKY